MNIDLNFVPIPCNKLPTYLKNCKVDSCWTPETVPLASLPRRRKGRISRAAASLILPVFLPPALAAVAAGPLPRGRGVSSAGRDNGVWVVGCLGLRIWSNGLVPLPSKEVT